MLTQIIIISRLIAISGCLQLRTTTADVLKCKKLANRDTQPIQLQSVPVCENPQVKTTTVDEQNVDLEKNMSTSCELMKENISSNYINFSELHNRGKL